MVSNKFKCVECGADNNSLIKTYRKQGLFNLSRCKQCSKVVDPYMEYELILILLDLILLKKKAFYHLLFNIQPVERKFLLCLIYVLSETCIFSQLLCFFMQWVLVKDRSSFDVFDFYILFIVSISEYAIYLAMTTFFLEFYSRRLSIRFNREKALEILLVSSYGKLFSLATTIWCHQDIIISMLLSRSFVFVSSFLAIKVFFEIGGWRIFCFLMVSTLSSQCIGFVMTS